MAILLTTMKAPEDAELRIVTDSKYCIEGLAKHSAKWEDKGWIDVTNAEVFKAIVTTLRQRTAPTTFQWVKGHDGNVGNEGADTQAGKGSGQ